MKEAKIENYEDVTQALNYGSLLLSGQYMLKKAVKNCTNKDRI